MRRISEDSSSRPLVGLVTDAVSGYGRAVLHGVMRHANKERRWLIHREFRATVDAPLRNWPDCDGAILAGVDEAVVRRVVRRCKHVVHCSGSGDTSQTAVVCLDDYAAGAIAAEHLMDCRLQHFGYLGFQGYGTSRSRYRGFRDKLASRGFTCTEAGLGWPQPSALVDHAHWPAMIKWVSDLPKPVGILAVDDNAAHDLAGACLAADIAVPDRVAIVGVNNDDLLCDSAWPPLSSVEADYSRVGFHAAALLDRMLSGEVVSPQDRHVEFPPLGVVRRISTDILAVDDPNLAEAMRFIREHACDPCDVRDVLRHVRVGRRWLERQFKKKLSRNPHDEIMRVRLETAKRLLLHTGLALPEIAERCGFGANQNFGRVFRKMTQSTPAAYRREVLRGSP